MAVETGKFLSLSGLAHYDSMIKSYIATSVKPSNDLWTAFLAGLDTQTPAPTLAQIKSDLETLKGSGEGSVAKALADAKAYADSLVMADGKSKFDAAGSADAALVTAKAYTDALAAGAVKTNADAIAALEDRVDDLDTSASNVQTLINNSITALDLPNTYDAKGAAAAAETAAKTYADGLDTAMDTRVKALEAIDHDHSNKAELDLIKSGDVAKWDNATTAINEFLTGTGTAEVVDTLKDIQDWMNGEGVNTTELTTAIAAEAKSRKDADDAIDAKIGTVTEGKTVVGMIGEAEAAANTYADGKAAAAETAAKAHAETKADEALTAAKADAANLYVAKTNFISQEEIDALFTQA